LEPYLWGTPQRKLFEQDEFGLLGFDFVTLGYA